MMKWGILRYTDVCQYARIHMHTQLAHVWEYVCMFVYMYTNVGGVNSFTVFSIYQLHVSH